MASSPLALSTSSCGKDRKDRRVGSSAARGSGPILPVNALKITDAPRGTADG